jgi:hypothetical protein
MINNKQRKIVDNKLIPLGRATKQTKGDFGVFRESRTVGRFGMIP